MPSLDDAYNLLSPEALSGKDFKYYVDVTEGRGDNPIAPVKRIILKNPKGKEQILFSGYRGCGKSTELNKLQNEITDQCLVVNFSVLKELDPVNLNYVELFIVMMEKLFEMVKNHPEINISKEFIDSIHAFTKSEDLETIVKYGGGLDIDTGLDTKYSIASLFGFFAKLRLSGNVSHSVKKTIKEAVEHRLSDLIKQCNDFIREIHYNSGNKGLVIVIEDLDKILLEKAEELFFNNGHIISQLNAHVIFTFPISLRYHAKANSILSNFSECFDLPMVKVKDKQGNVFPAGRNALYQIVVKRLTPACFESTDIIYQFIDKCGGCLRDLFRMLRNAADNALTYERETISEADFRKGYLKLKRDYEGSIAELRDKDNKIIVTVQEYYDMLVKTATSADKKVDNNKATLDLRQNLCILGYNDEGWCDVHPIVRDILKERKLID